MSRDFFSVKRSSSDGIHVAGERQRRQRAHPLGPVLGLHRKRAVRLLGRLNGVREAGVRAAENEARDAFGMPECELLADHPSKRYAKEVAALDAETIEERRGVVGELRGRVRTRCDRRAPAAAVVVGNHPPRRREALGQRRPVARDPGDARHEEKRSTFATLFVVDLDIGEDCGRHALSLHQR